MTALLCIAMLIAQPAPDSSDSPSHKIRIGPCFGLSWPSMQDEKDFAQFANDAGVDYELGSVALTGSLELLGDVNERFRIRGGLSVSNLHGTYEDDYNPYERLMIGIFTFGIGLLFYSQDDVIGLDDQAVSIEAQAYYMLNRSNNYSISVGAGPVYTWAKRKLNSPNTFTSGSGSNLGIIASIRLDQESSYKIGCVPLLLGFEAGYRYSSIELDDSEAEGFTLDFSGPFLKVGSYIGF